ncbi:MAG: D-alanyl-D-alanine carboxypeptidase/D-alanyl-D-alanine-endopeptidase, partial [Acidobacteriota bacterium]
MRAASLSALTGLCLALLTSLEAAARSPQFKPAVNSQVAAARRVAPAIGVHIVELASGETAYSYNASTRRILASNTKIVTSAAALDRLGPGYFFETEVLARGDISGEHLKGDLAILGGGDPSLSGRDYQGDVFGPFREWAAALGRLGIRRIEGDLYLVHGLFDSQFVHPDWPQDQLTRWYEAPVAALSFNDNCVLVRVRPGARPGRPAKIEMEPELPLFRLENQALTTGRGRSQTLEVDRKRQKGEENVLTVGGRVYSQTESYDHWVAVADPVAYFGAALEAAFTEEGVQIDGRIYATPTRPRPEAARSNGHSVGGPWRRVSIHRTDLLTVLQVVNKRSQNFYAESVLKTLGARHCGDGSWAGGLRVVSEFLDDAGLPPGSYDLADGSGMSRNNRFAPEQLTHLLRTMFHHRWGPEYVETLPTSGER